MARQPRPARARDRGEDGSSSRSSRPRTTTQTGDRRRLRPPSAWRSAYFEGAVQCRASSRTPGASGRRRMSRSRTRRVLRCQVTTYGVPCATERALLHSESRVVARVHRDGRDGPTGRSSSTRTYLRDLVGRDWVYRSTWSRLWSTPHGGSRSPTEVAESPSSGSGTPATRRPCPTGRPQPGQQPDSSRRPAGPKARTYREYDGDAHQLQAPAPHQDIDREAEGRRAGVVRGGGWRPCRRTGGADAGCPARAASLPEAQRSSRVGRRVPISRSCSR